MTFEEWWDTCGDATWWNKGQPTSWLASKAAWEAASHEPHLIPAAWTRIIESVLARVLAGEPAAQVVADYADEHGHTIEGLERVSGLVAALRELLVGVELTSWRTGPRRLQQAVSVVRAYLALLEAPTDGG